MTTNNTVDMAAALEESAGSLLQESLNLGDVFGSRYLGDLAKESLVDANGSKKRETRAKAEECSDSESASDADGNDIQSEAATKRSHVQQRRRRVGSGGGTTQRRQSGGGPGRPVRRVVKDAGEGNGAVLAKFSQSSPGQMNSPKKENQNDVDHTSRKAPVRQRRRDPRVQNTAINTPGADTEKEKPNRAIRRDVPTSDDLLMTPSRKPRNAIKEGAMVVAAAANLTADAQSERSRRRRSSGRATSPRRAASPRKSRQDDCKINKDPYKGRATPTDAESESSRMESKSPDVIVQYQQRVLSTPVDHDGSHFPESHGRRIDDIPQFPESQHRSHAELIHIMEQHQQSPRSLNEAEDELIEEASRGSQSGAIKPYYDKDSSDEDEEDEEEELNQSATVLQFDPTQAGGVFMAKQASTEDSDIHMKNKDGSECVFNIAGMADPLGDVFSRQGQPATQPMFDFLGDQPDEEQQEHTESAEREAFEESIKLREILPPSPDPVGLSLLKVGQKVPPKTRPKSESRPGEPSTSTSHGTLQAPKKRVVRGTGKPRTRPPMVSRSQSSSEPATRPTPIKRGVKSSKTMSSRHSPRQVNAPETEEKSHKKLVNDSKNYSRFFYDSKSEDKAADAELETTVLRPNPKPRQRVRRSTQKSEDAIGYSESETEQVPRPRRTRKKPAPGAEGKIKKQQGPPPTTRNRKNNDSFALSDTEGRGGKLHRGKGDAFAFSDTEAMGSKRREFKPDFKAGPFPFAPSVGADPIGSSKLNNSASGLFADNPDISDLAKSPVKSFEKPPVETTSDNDTDNEKSDRRGKKSHVIGSIGRYFGRKGKSGGSGTEVDQSDTDNASVKSGSSRLFGARRVKQQHFSLLSGSVSSMEDTSLDFDLPK